MDLVENGYSMKIAIMMRAMDQDSGHRAIIEGLIENMLEIDQENTYLLLYRSSKWFGRFSSYRNTKEILVHAPQKFLWDQIAVPYRAWREGADIIYNEKFSVPLISHCPVAMGIHEPAWWAWPEHYEWWDIAYIKTMLPLYCRKASVLFAISNFIIEENRKYIGLSFNKAVVTYPAPREYFRPIHEPGLLESFREKYQLPERFILGVTRVDHVGNENPTYYGGKNVETIIRAYLLSRHEYPHKLVIAGRNVKEYLLHTGWTRDELEGVHFIGFVPHKEIPKLYNLASLFVIPSFYESYAMAMVEAMSCGCPVIASKTGACPEIGGGAAVLADPKKPEDFSQKMVNVLTNEDFRIGLRKKSLDRSTFFNWERSANITLQELKKTVRVMK